MRDVFIICMNDSWSQTVACGLLPSAVEIYKTTEYKSFISVLIIYLNFQSRYTFNSVIIYIWFKFQNVYLH